MGDVEISFDLGKLKKILLFGFLVAVLALELNLTFTSPIAFGDEGVHVAVARYIGTEVDYSKYTPLSGSVLYPENFARPALWNIMEGSFYFLFGFSDGIVKFLVPFLSFLTGLSIYIFGRKLYSENLGIIAAVLAVTIPSFITYSVLFYTTVPYVFFFTLAFLTGLTAIKTGERKWWVLSGIFSGVSILANIAGLFLPVLFAVMGCYHLLTNRSMRGLVEALKTYGLALLIIFLVVMPLFARNYGLYATPDCNVRDIFQGRCSGDQAYEQVTANEFAGRNVGGGTEDSILNVGVATYLRFAYGFGVADPNVHPIVSAIVSFLNLVGLVFIPFSFIAGMAVLLRKRDVLSVTLLVSAIVFIVFFSWFGGLVEGRSEDTARYFLSATPLIGIAGAAYWSSIRKDDHKMNGLVVLAVIIIVFGLSFLGLYTKVAQMQSTKGFVPSFFQACDWVEENLPEDARLLSLHNYPTRYNCDRPAVWETPDKADIVLSNNVTLVESRLEANGLNYIFVQKFALSNTPFGQNYPVSFVDFLEANNRTFTKVYENGPRYGTQEFVNCVNGGGCDPGNIVYKVNFS